MTTTEQENLLSLLGFERIGLHWWRHKSIDDISVKHSSLGAFSDKQLWDFEHKNANQQFNELSDLVDWLIRVGIITGRNSLKDEIRNLIK